MRLLITGGAGTLGCNIINHLAPTVEAVHVIDNFTTSQPSDIPHYSNVTVQEGSIATTQALTEAFQHIQPTYVIHCAASYKDPSNWLSDIETNVTGAANVSHFSDAFGVRRLISIQTVLCYGRPASLPIPVDAPLRPESSYAISKVAGDQYLAIGSTPFVSLRVGNVISPGLAIGPIPTFYKKLKAGEPVTVSTSVRDFLDITDFLNALDRVLDDEAPTGSFNISSGNGTSMQEIFEIVANYLGVEGEPELVAPGRDDIPEIVLDPSHTETTLGWKVNVSVTDSVVSCLQGYDRTGVGEIHSHLRAPGATR